MLKKSFQPKFPESLAENLSFKNSLVLKILLARFVLFINACLKFGLKFKLSVIGPYSMFLQ